MNYVAQNPQELTSAYPYTARDGTCRFDKSQGKVSVTGVKTVTAGSSSALLDAIAQQPVSVTVEADKSVFQGYKSGILNSAACGTSLDHAITAVGYGHDSASNQDFYIVRNSWGSGWGDKGYIRIAATASGKGICGIQQISVYPSTN